MTHHPRNQLHLVADIGGTNTRVALAKGDALIPDTLSKFANADFDDLGSVLRHFITGQGGVDCAGACVAVAGPVHDGVAHLTNLNWTVDREILADVTGAEKVAILNDLQAQGHGLAIIEQDALTSVMNAPEPPVNAAKLVVGIGTGFNASVVFDLGAKTLVPPSEAGHIDLPVLTSDDLDLANLIREKQGFCAVDDVLSGRGLEHIYQWCSQKSLEQTQRSSHEILRSVLGKTDDVAAEAVRIFARLAGITIGNIALTHLPFGGIFLAGGMARAIAPHLMEYGFPNAFCSKGRFTEFMGSFNVSVIQDDAAALTGCANFLQNLD